MLSIDDSMQYRVRLYNLTLIGSWKKTYVNGKGGNDPKTKIAVTFFLLKT